MYKIYFFIQKLIIWSTIIKRKKLSIEEKKFKIQTSIRYNLWNQESKIWSYRLLNNLNLIQPIELFIVDQHFLHLYMQSQGSLIYMFNIYCVQIWPQKHASNNIFTPPTISIICLVYLIFLARLCFQSDNHASLDSNKLKSIKSLMLGLILYVLYAFFLIGQIFIFRNSEYFISH